MRQRLIIPHARGQFFKFSEIGVEEVTAVLRNLKISKATGIDMIPSRALKIAADIIATSITWIFNLSLLTHGKRLAHYQFTNPVIDDYAKTIGQFRSCLS
jgi:hypothetical protein